ncbi:MAG TPA: YncE family protein [Vicinamibacterales bacterium]|jgi:YVTN family beta-propeller protein
MTSRFVIAAVAAWLVAAGAAAQTPPPPAEPVGSKLIEIYRLAPGQHEAFLRAIAQYDEANRRAGIPPRQLYVHSDGASWDFLLIQDAEYPEGKGPLVTKAFKDLGLPSGPRFFTEFRKFITEHTDTFASGPTTAAAYLAALDATPRVAADGGAGPDTAHYELTRTVALGGTPRWDYLQVDSPARRLYLAHDATVDVLDLGTQTVVGRVNGLAGAHGIALAPGLDRGYVANGDRQSVSAFSLATLRIVGEARTGREPDSVTFEPISRRVFVWNGGSRDVTILDAATLHAVKTLPLGGTPEFAVADGRGAVFANIAETHEIVRIDAAGATIAARLPIAGCESPGALAFDSSLRRLFSACGNGVLIALEADTGKALGSARIGRGADAVVFDAAGSRVLVSSVDGTIAVIAVSADGTLRELPGVQTRATGRTMAFDPATGTVFVPAVDITVDWTGRTASFVKDGLKLYVFERRAP